MRFLPRQLRDGQTVLEVLLGLALLSIVAAASISLSFRYLEALNRSNDFKTVATISQESFEAVESIGRSSWESLDDGTYGLTQTTAWALQGTPDVVRDRFTRTVTVEPVYRDSSCQIISEGGVNDPDTKKVTVSIAWETSGRELSTTGTKYYSNWSNPSALCASSQAGNLNINVDGAVLDQTKKQLEGILLENTSSVPIVIDKLTVSWIKCEQPDFICDSEEYTSQGNVFSIKIDGEDVWHSSNGIGSPSGVQPSETVIDIVDLTLEPNTTYPLDRVRFDTKLDGSQFTLTAIMGDLSQTQVTTESFLP